MLDIIAKLIIARSEGSNLSLIGERDSSSEAESSMGSKQSSRSEN